MRYNAVVLSLFPGIGLLDKAFEDAGFQVVRGPDLIWGGDVRRFHVNSNMFAGIIGGPPCQTHSTAGEIVGSQALANCRAARTSWLAFSTMGSLAGTSFS